jgi:hypothetical protein
MAENVASAIALLRKRGRGRRLWGPYYRLSLPASTPALKLFQYYVTSDFLYA